VSDTIFALASGFGRAGIAVIRISGPEAAKTVGALLDRRSQQEQQRGARDETLGKLPQPRRASLRRRYNPVSGELLDQALVLWLPGPGTFTGEDQVELHIHGGLAVRAAVLGALTRLPGCRAAEPGEFTRRAFVNGRLDLSAVEGLADLIDAETEAQRRQALRQLEGALAHQVQDWRRRLIEASACLEAALDFTDEEDVPAEIADRASVLMDGVRNEIQAALADASRGERLREGFGVVIAGPPNSGKSTLLNALARRDVAIVSPIAGTTRDAIEVRCDLGGLPVTFVDTAGLRETLDPIEHAGIARTQAHMEKADLVLWLEPPDADIGAARPEGGSATIRVRTKADVAHPTPGSEPEVIAISAKTGSGLDTLIDRVRTQVEAGLGVGDALITRERHRVALAETAASLERADAVLRTGRDELAAEDLRLALRALGRITGQVDVEEVLDRIFGQFCIGK
jgi:tRNA modification GTPase